MKPSLMLRHRCKCVSVLPKRPPTTPSGTMHASWASRKVKATMYLRLKVIRKCGLRIELHLRCARLSLMSWDIRPPLAYLTIKQSRKLHALITNPTDRPLCQSVTRDKPWLMYLLETYAGLAENWVNNLSKLVSRQWATFSPLTLRMSLYLSLAAKKPDGSKRSLLVFVVKKSMKSKGQNHQAQSKLLNQSTL